jgi:hypothetical protein
MFNRYRSLKFLSQILASILVIIFIFSNIIQLNVKAATPPVIKYNPDGTYASESYFKADLTYKGIYTNTQSKDANYTVYSDKYYDHQIVYGGAHNNTGESTRYSKTTGRQEYRYLGYNFGGNDVTNSMFPPDPNGGGSPSSWHYTEVSGASTLWNNMNDADIKSYMLSEPLTYNGVSTGLSVNNIGTANALIKSTASWAGGFSVYTEHYYNGSKRYATLQGDPMGGVNVGTSITPNLSDYTIGPEQDNAVVNATVKGWASFSGFTKPSQVNLLTVGCTNNNTYQNAGPGYTGGITYTSQIILNRSNYPASNTDVSKTVTIKSYVKLTSKYNDEIDGQASTTIQLTIKPLQKPTVTTVSSANPTSIYEKDRGVTPITVHVAGTISSATNVDHWEVYARRSEDTTSYQSYSGQAHDFTFYIPTSQVGSQVF